MSRKEKLLKRLKSRPKDFTYDEARILLLQLGFEENNKGKTSGSRVVFKKDKNTKIQLHKPHPEKVLKRYQIESLLEDLNRYGVI